MVNSIDILKDSFFDFLEKNYSLSKEDTARITFTINVNESKQSFGDINSNAPLILAKQLKKKPTEIGNTIIDTFSHEHIAKIELAGAGFLNIFLAIGAIQTIAQNLFENPKDSFKSHDLNNKQHYSLEFVSANPTGPLHLGHGRGGILGDVLGNVLQFLGHDVTKEYYINDAGSQMQKLGTSFKARCLQALNIDSAIPEDGYQGDYLKDLAQDYVAKHGESLVQKDDTFFIQEAQKELLKLIEKTLSDYGVTFDVWFSEKSLHNSGAIETSLGHLTNQGHTFEKDGALWFSSTKFDDDKDRVLKKSNNELTYIAADVAYLKDKIDRGATHLIMILGQDHHSYVSRLKGIMTALGYNKDMLDVILYQLVTIKKTGEQVRMSKRAGTMVTLQEIIDVVGKDVARFFYLNKKADTHLEFNLDLALKKTDENPVYYIQYAYVRIKSILEKANKINELKNINQSDVQYVSNSEKLLLKKIIALKELLQSVERTYETHLLTYYLFELASMFHSYYNKNKVIDPTQINTSRGRLITMKLLHNTFELVLNLLGISKPNKM